MVREHSIVPLLVCGVRRDINARGALRVLAWPLADHGVDNAYREKGFRIRQAYVTAVKRPPS